MDISKQNSATSRRGDELPAVLIVEDNDDARFEMATLLRGDGFAVTETADAEEGLRALRVGAFDVILLDLWLPGMNGWSFRAEQRAEKALSAIPVVVITADSSPQARVIDADAVLQKPFGAELLTQTIRKVLAARSTEPCGATDLVSEALTLLATAVGHEVGNALMGLIYTIESARTESTKGSSVEQDLGLMLDDCRRISHSLRTLRELPCPPSTREADVDLDKVVRAAIAHVDPEGTARIAFEGDANAWVRGDASVLRYVCVALLHNAVEALPRRKTGSESRERRLSNVDVRLHHPPGEIALDVCDFGALIPDTELTELFSLYSPGRERAWGAGVRLWFARHAVLGLGGAIEVTNVGNAGVRCRVRLPDPNQR